MRATIVLILLLIITGTVACGGASNRHYTVAAVTPAVVLPPNEPAATRPATEFAGTNTTRVEYRLTIDPTVATKATVIQIIKKNDETGDTGYLEQVLTPVDKTRREYWIALPPGMRHIVFYIEGDDNNGAESFSVFDGDREVTFLPRGTFHGRKIWTIEESTSTIANN